MASGHLWHATVTPADIFAFNYIVQEPLRTFGSFPAGLAAGAGRGARAACPGVAGESRTRRADAGAGVGARLASLRASGGRARGRARGGVAVLRLQRGVLLLAHVLWRAAAGRGVSGRARGSNAVVGAGVDWPAGRVGRARTLPHGCGVRGADCAVAAAAGRGPGADRCAGRARWPSMGRGVDGLQRRAQRQPVAAHDHARHRVALVRRWRPAARGRYPRHAPAAPPVVDAASARRRLSRVSRARPLAIRDAGCSSGC